MRRLAQAHKSCLWRGIWVNISRLEALRYCSTLIMSLHSCLILLSLLLDRSFNTVQLFVLWFNKFCFISKSLHYYLILVVALVTTLPFISGHHSTFIMPKFSCRLDVCHTGGAWALMVYTARLSRRRAWALVFNAASLSRKMAWALVFNAAACHAGGACALVVNAVRLSRRRAWALVVTAARLSRRRGVGSNG